MSIEQAMLKPIAPPERFQVGDRVAHISLGDGVVTAREPSHVQVTYDEKYKKEIVSVGGKHIVQNYDAAWFVRNPKFLFHRS